jgi:hypothetical protein
MGNLIEEVENCKSRIKKLDRSFRDGLYHELGCISVLAFEFLEDVDAWAEFRTHDFWQKRKPPEDPDIDEVLLWTCRFVFRARSSKSPRYNRAFKYAQALKALDTKGMSAAEVASELKKAGGVETLLGFPENREDPLDPGDGEDDEDDEDDEAEDVEEVVDDPDPTDKDQNAMLMVKMTDDQFREIGQMHTDQTAFIEVVCTSRSRGSYVHLEAVGVAVT